MTAHPPRHRLQQVCHHLMSSFLSAFYLDPTSIPGITIDMPDYEDMEYSGDFSNEGSGLTDDEDL